MPVSYNSNNNKTKYITSTLSSICRAEYRTFVNHTIANVFSYTYSALQMYMPRSLLHEPKQARYARIYFVL